MATISQLSEPISTTASATLATSGISASVGDMLVVFVAADNNGTNGAASLTGISDIGANTFTGRGGTSGIVNQDPGAAAAGTTLGIYTSLLTEAISSAAITANFSPDTTSKAMQVWRIQPDAGRVLAYSNAGAGATGSTATPSITAVGLASGVILFGALASETSTGVTGDADTTNGSWSASDGSVANTGTVATSMRLDTQYKVTTGAGDQTYNPTHGVARDCAINWVSFLELARVPIFDHHYRMMR